MYNDFHEMRCQKIKSVERTNVRHCTSHRPLGHDYEQALHCSRGKSISIVQHCTTAACSSLHRACRYHTQSLTRRLQWLTSFPATLSSQHNVNIDNIEKR
ncbi:hypothetical protein O6H91_06G096800 [Diphasiastrum complanatum]|uniref:Uncharacterized protein n=1 Tax=Diphasiastrum complanatum TaxID=34168 RepID=A0ACC2DGI0_DIPCM|nr:hypothetical protein O6H91_06G096800 [Diphasiastrum complanatum]